MIWLNGRRNFWSQPVALLFGCFALLEMTLRGAEAGTNAPPYLPALAAFDRTWLTFGLDRISWLQHQVMGNPLWQYLASLIYIVLAFYISKLLDYVIQVQ